MIRHIRPTFGAVVQAMRFLGPYRKKYYLGLVLSLLELLVLFAVPFFNRQAVLAISSADPAGLVRFTVVGSLLLLSVAPWIVVGRYLMSAAVTEGAAVLKKTLYHRLLTRSREAAVSSGLGDDLEKLNQDADRSVKLLTSYGVTCLIRFGFTFPVVLILLGRQNLQLLLFALLYALISLALSIRLNPYVKKLEKEAKRESIRSSEQVMEAVRGALTIRAYSLQDHLLDAFKKTCVGIRKKRERFQSANGFTYGIIDFFTFSAQAAAFAAGTAGLLLLNPGRLQETGIISDLVYQASLVGLMGDAMLRLSTFLLLIQPSLVSLERVAEGLSIQSEPGERPEEANVIVQKQLMDNNAMNSVPACELDKICFGYDSGNMILKDFSMTTQKGERIAVLGPSGRGKTTILHLLEGLLTPQSGSIRIWGNEQNTYSHRELRGCFAFVPQSAELFEGTVRENVRYGYLESDEQTIRQALQMAGVLEEIESRPEGLDTSLGTGGEGLSGGQRQRIAIARALVRILAQPEKPMILLMDEPTSALDQVSEEGIIQIIEQLPRSVTLIAVTHSERFSGRMDRVIRLL